jgi:hypothetical protein
MGSIKVKLTDGPREIELEGDFVDVQQIITLWLGQKQAVQAPTATGTPPPPSSSNTSAGKADHITTDTTWTGTITIDRNTSVDAGVTLTIAAGTAVTINSGAGLTIAGVVDIQGTAASNISLAAPSATEGHAGLAVLGGGELRMNHATLSGGGISIGPSGKATIADSTLTNPRSAPDVVSMNGGTLDMQHSEINLAAGDGGHTALLFNGAANKINVTHCTIRGAPYGLMFYGGKNAVFNNNNWDNDINVDATSGVSGDFSGSYFRGGAPVSIAGASLTALDVSSAPLGDAKPRS